MAGWLQRRRERNTQRAYDIWKRAQTGADAISNNERFFMENYIQNHKERFNSKVNQEKLLQNIKDNTSGWADQMKQNINDQAIQNLKNLSPKQEVTPDQEQIMQQQVDKRLADLARLKRENDYVDNAIADKVVNQEVYNKTLKDKGTKAAYDYATGEVRKYQKDANKTLAPGSKRLSVDGLYGKKSRAALSEYNKVKEEAAKVAANVGLDETATPGEVTTRVRSAYNANYYPNNTLTGADSTFVFGPTSTMLDSISRVWNPAQGDTISYRPDEFGADNYYKTSNGYIVTPDRIIEKGTNAQGNLGVGDSLVRQPISYNGLTLEPDSTHEQGFINPKDSARYWYYANPDSIALQSNNYSDITPVGGRYARGIEDGDTTYYVNQGHGYVPMQFPDSIPSDSTFIDTNGTQWGANSNGNWTPGIIKPHKATAADLAAIEAWNAQRRLMGYKTGGQIKRFQNGGSAQSQEQQEIQQLAQAYQTDPQAKKTMDEGWVLYQKQDPQNAQKFYQQYKEMTPVVLYYMQMKQSKKKQTAVAANGLKLAELNGKCPEGYEVEKYLIGGKSCKCKKKPVLTIAEELKCGGKKRMSKAECGKKMPKHAKGGNLTKKKAESLKYSGGPGDIDSTTGMHPNKKQSKALPKKHRFGSKVQGADKITIIGQPNMFDWATFIN